MPYVQIDVETFCELIELTREKLTVLTNSCTACENLWAHHTGRTVDGNQKT
jgi:hypothetical protein